MKYWYLLFMLNILDLSLQAQSPIHNSPELPASNCNEQGKVTWEGYDKKQSFTNNPLIPNEDLHKSVADTSSIHSQEWLPQKSSSTNSPCAKAKPPINL